MTIQRMCQVVGVSRAAFYQSAVQPVGRACRLRGFVTFRYCGELSHALRTLDTLTPIPDEICFHDFPCHRSSTASSRRNTPNPFRNPLPLLFRNRP